MHCYVFYKYLNICFMDDLDCLRRGLGLSKGRKNVSKHDLILYPSYFLNDYSFKLFFGCTGSYLQCVGFV